MYMFATRLRLCLKSISYASGCHGSQRLKWNRMRRSGVQALERPPQYARTHTMTSRRLHCQLVKRNLRNCLWVCMRVRINQLLYEV